MNKINGYKSFLVETIKFDIKQYLNFLKEVYSGNLPIDTNTLELKYKLKKSCLSNIINDELKITSLDELQKIVSECKKCNLYASRKNTVFGKGSAKERLVIIGEAPGADEDETGEPFVGRAGQLLTKMLSAIGIDRESVFICNVLKCRPPNNRDPLPDEISKCSYYLDKQLEFLKPKYILALGRIAAIRLLNKEATMKEFREGKYIYNGIPVLVTYHPSALLRNPNWKYPAWEDLKRMKELLDSSNG
ncbi:MAG: uracil-DNA glycosylase [Candidatus Delongbacteria bacterium]|nr:uracil-DNA glycosylase [Candidatus Delongbacteria bacterium]MCG2760444.1 uracil-DNA glycosylase [Candidatus Delongbacteria bacterium]